MSESTLEAAAAERSALVVARKDGERGQSLPLVVSLHARGGDAVSDLQRARRLFGALPDIVALQAARPCNPMQSNLRAAPAYSGFAWYLGDEPSRPEAASFGDALAQVELFTCGLSRPFVLVGEEQGGVLALTLAMFKLDRLAGVHAARAGIPAIDRWQLPRADIRDVSVVLDGLDAASFLQAREALAARGARIGSAAAGKPLEQWLAALSSSPRGAS